MPANSTNSQQQAVTGTVSRLQSGEALLEAALTQGDYRRVLTLLMNQYGNQIYRFCLRMVKEQGMAEDVHQMTFVQAYESLPAFKGHSSLRTWLFSIARNRCLDSLKMTRRRERRITLVEQLPETAGDQHSDAQLSSGGFSAQLARCLRQLAPHIRSAVLLRFQAEHSYQEISQICSEKPATLQARVVRALPVLRHCLEQGGITSESL